MNVTITLELIESMIEEDTCSGSVLVLELKHAMEHSISEGLVGGRCISLRDAFEEAWSELVVLDPPIDMEIPQST